jgi:hypothetical protein
MNKTIKITLLTMLIIVFFIGCKSVAKVSANNSSGFSQAEAIAEPIKKHPDFPINPNNTITKELPIGGKSGSTSKVKFTTKVESSGVDKYLVTLTKDWGITVNGTYVKSFWKYEVTPNNTKLIDSVDNDNLPNIIK